VYLKNFVAYDTHVLLREFSVEFETEGIFKLRIGNDNLQKILMAMQTGSAICHVLNGMYNNTTLPHM
jgi:hypothetical protein